MIRAIVLPPFSRRFLCAMAEVKTGLEWTISSQTAKEWKLPFWRGIGRFYGRDSRGKESCVGLVFCFVVKRILVELRSRDGVMREPRGKDFRLYESIGLIVSLTFSRRFCVSCLRQKTRLEWTILFTNGKRSELVMFWLFVFVNCFAHVLYRVSYGNEWNMKRFLM